MDESGQVIVGLIVVVVILVVYLVPIIKILHKAGYSGWWCLLFFVPLVNFIMLWGVRLCGLAEPARQTDVIS